MRSLRRGLGLAGGLVLVFGLLVAVVPDVATGLRIGDLVTLLGNDYLLVVPLAVLAAVAVLVVLVDRARSGIDQATPPDREGVPTAPHPGSEFDRLADGGVGLIGRLVGDETRRVRDDLRETAVRTVMRADGCSRERARDRVVTGEWTDDRAAAEFLADGTRESGLVGLLRDRTAFGRGARRTATAIVHYSERPAYADGGRGAGDATDRDQTGESRADG